MKFRQTINFLKKHTALIIVMILTVLFMVGVRVHYNNYFYGRYHVDEYHTIYQGLNLIVHGKVDNFRAQEGTRWLVRAFYPYGLIKMNTLMGGNVWIQDWDYPGHNYIVENLVDNYNPDTIRNDPNLRDFIYYLRIPYVLLVALSFFLLCLFLFKRKYFISAVFLIVLLGVNKELIKEQGLFYIEPAMVAFINALTLVFVYFVLDKIKITWKSMLGVSFLMAITISTKFSTIVFVLLPVSLVFLNVRDWRERGKQLLWLFISLPVFYALINFPAFISLESFNLFLHDFTSNFWQYAAGSRDAYTVVPGLSHLKTILNQFKSLIGPVLYIVPLVIIYGWYKARQQERRILEILVVVFLLTVFSLSSQRIYFARNALPFYTTFVFITLFSLDIISRGLMQNKKVRKWAVPIGALLIISCGVGFVANSGGIQKYIFHVLLTPKSGFFKNTQEVVELYAPPKIYSVGFEQSFFDEKDYKDSIEYLPDAPDPLHNTNYAEFESKFSELPADSMVVAHRIKNNKHVTNYILPKYFNKNRQNGNYYVFYNESPPSSRAESERSEDGVKGPNGD